MTAITIGLMVLYWAVYTAEHVFRRVLNKHIRENAHELKLSTRARDEARITAAESRHKTLKKFEVIREGVMYFEIAVAAIVIAIYVLPFLAGLVRWAVIIIGYCIGLL